MPPKTPETKLAELIKQLEDLVEGKASLGIELGAVFGKGESVEEALAQSEAFSLAIKETNKQITKQSNKVQDLTKVLKGDLGKRLGLTRKQFAAVDKEIKLVAADLEKTSKAADMFGTGLAKGIKGMLGMRGASNSLTGNISKLGQGFASSGTTFKKEMKSFSSEMGGLGGFVSDITTAMSHKAQELLFVIGGLALQIDAMRASLNLATLSAGKYADISESALKTNMHLGATMEDAADVTVMLSRAVHLAGEENQQYAKDLVDISVKMKVLGADTTSMNRILNFYQKGLGQSSQESKQFLKEAFKLGVGLQIGVGDAVTLLGNSFDQLSFRGKGWLNISKEIAAMSRATGVEMAQLMGVAGQFDTFEGAANAAAKLNTAIGIMGGTKFLSGTRLHRMEEHERLKLLHKTFNMQQKTFDQLGPYQKRYVALALGMRSAGEAQEFLSSNFADYQTYMGDIEKATAAQEDFDKALKDGMPAIAELKKALLEMAIKFTPAILSLLKHVEETLIPFLSGLDFSTLVSTWTLAFAGPGILALFGTIAGLMTAAGAASGSILGVGAVLTALGLGGSVAAGQYVKSTEAEKEETTFHSGGAVLRGGRATLRTGELVLNPQTSALVTALLASQGGGNTGASQAPSAISLNGATLEVNITGAQKDKIFAKVVNGYFANV